MDTFAAHNLSLRAVFA